MRTAVTWFCVQIIFTLANLAAYILNEHHHWYSLLVAIVCTAGAVYWGFAIADEREHARFMRERGLRS